MTSVYLPKVSRAEGSVTLAGSKSIANRILPMVAFSSNTQPWIIQNLPKGEDVELMLGALQNLGSKIEKETQSDHIINIKISSIQKIGSHCSFLHLGNSGTSMRFLTGILSVQKEGVFVLDGISRMRQRPIFALVKALQEWKNSLNKPIEISFLGDPSFPPLKLKAKGFLGGFAQVSGDVSSQFLTSLLMTMPFSEKPISIQVQEHCTSKPYIDMTIKMLENIFGIVFQTEVQNDKRIYSLVDPKGYIGLNHRQDYLVEIDASSASYFLALGAIAGTEEGVCVKNFPVLKDLQGEAEFLEVLIDMGVNIRYKVQDKWFNQSQWDDLEKKPSICDVCVSQARLKAVRHNVETMSDTGMTLAMVALFAKGETVIQGVRNWRYKETDRIEAMKTELLKLGAKVISSENELRIIPPNEWKEAEIETYNDHRMAMCFSLACLSPVAVTILNSECSKKTYPHYFEDFQKLCQS